MLLLRFIQSLMTTEKKFLMIPLVGINDYFEILNLLVLCLDMGTNNQSIWGIFININLLILI